MAILGYKDSTLFVRSFGMDEWLRTRGLAGWLEIATDGLEDPARQRIAIEIEGHYAEAVNAHLAAGEPELSAQAKAVAELGDPQEAALKFQKNHLTEIEAKWMKSLEWTASKPFFSFWSPLLDGISLAGCALLLSYGSRNSRHLFDSYFLAGFLLAGYAGFRLIPRLLYFRARSRNSFRRGLALCGLITTKALFLAYAAFLYMQDRDFWGGLNALFIIYVWGFAFNPGFRIWNKLRKIE
jgi:hypothetical protein